jgi:hypothetical protein
LPYLIDEEVGVPGENHAPTMGKQLVSFIACGCESSAPFLLFTKPGANPGRTNVDSLVVFVFLNRFKTYWVFFVKCIEKAF